MRKSLIVSLLVFSLLVLSDLSFAAGSKSNDDLEVQIEQLVLSAYKDKSQYEYILAEAFSMAEELPMLEGAFYQAYITQCKFRIKVASIEDKLESSDFIDSHKLALAELEKEILKSIRAMNSVRSLIERKMPNSSSYTGNKRQELRALISRSDFCNAWCWYSLSKISKANHQYYLDEADKLFTSFLNKDYNKSNTPVLVNCLYGKGLCLRDSGRMYDLIIMLDNAPADLAEAVKFARLRLAAAVQLNLSIDILNIMQDYYIDNEKLTNLSAEELEMLVNCIEATVELLKRDLPDKMKVVLNDQLKKAVDMSDGYGSYWQNRVMVALDGIDINTSYGKLMQAFKLSEDGDTDKFSKISELVDQGMEMVEPGQQNKVKEFTYLKAISLWNLKDYLNCREKCIAFLEDYGDDNRSEQIADIAVQCCMRLVVEEPDNYQKYSQEVESYFLNDYIDQAKYLWISGSLMINAGKYLEAYNYFKNDKLELKPRIKRYYGIVLTIVPLVKSGDISPVEAADTFKTVCKQYILNNSNSEDLSSIAEIACDAISVFIENGDFDSAVSVLETIDILPNIKKSVQGRIAACNFQLAQAADIDINASFLRIKERNLQNDPYVFNSLLNYVSDKSRQVEDYNILAQMYKTLLSSSLLSPENALALRVKLADCYFNLKDYIAYIDTIEAIEKLNQNLISIDIYRRLGVSCQKVEKYEQAVEYWSIVQLNQTGLNELYKEALFNKIVCICCSGQSHKASQVLALALLRNDSLNSDSRFIELKQSITNFDMNLCGQLEWQPAAEDELIKIEE